MICTKFQPLIANQNEQISFSKHNEEFRVMNHECMSIHGLLWKLSLYHSRSLYFHFVFSLHFVNMFNSLFQGVLYHRWDKPVEAERAYRKALELEPSSPAVVQNLQMLQRKYGKNSNSQWEYNTPPDSELPRLKCNI